MALLVLVGAFLWGCSGGGSTSGSGSVSVPDNGPPVPTTRQILVRSVLQRAVPAAVTDLRFSGTDAGGSLVFGPETRGKAAEIVLTVPVTLTRLTIEYLEGSTVVGTFATDIPAGTETYAIEDPDWTDSIAPPPPVPSAGRFQAPGYLVAPVSWGLASGDLNGDGNVDLCRAGQLAFSVLLGRGNGLFQPATTYTVGYNTSVALGDLNEDGILDAALGGGRVSILIGTGDGTFGSPTEYSLGPVPSGDSGIALGDLNNDGHLDIAVTQLFDTTSILLGNGDGTFQAPQSFTSVNFQGIALADLDGDGTLDMVETSYNGTTVLRGNGDGTFAPPVAVLPAPQQGGGLAVRDFNGDGALDLAAPAATWINIAFGNGDGSFQPAQQLPIALTGNRSLGGLTAGDFNEDGNLDLVTNEFEGTGQLLPGNGDGTFAPSQAFPTTSSFNFISADLDKNGHLDLAVLNPSAVEIFLGTGQGDFVTNARSPGANNNSLATALGDLNGDGILDVVGGGGQGLASVALGTGDGTFQAAQSYPYPAQQILDDVAIADVNQDGKPDLTLCAQGQLFALPGNGDGTFGAAQSSPTGGVTTSFALGDVTGDGTLDGVAATEAGAVLMPGQGDGRFGEPQLLATGQGSVQYCTLADLNGDGSLDLATTSLGAVPLAVRLGHGDGTFAAAQAVTAAPFAYGAVAGDVNGDGILDLVTANLKFATVVLGNGDGTFGGPAQYGVFVELQNLALRDVDLDGRVDIVGADQLAELVTILPGNGDGTFQPGDGYAGGYSNDLAVGDLNGDGRPDVAATERILLQVPRD